MILVAGGELDFNLTALLRRLRRRRIKHASALLGPQRVPRLAIDMARDSMQLDGRALRPTGCFMRHDVFLTQTLRTNEANEASLNWYVAIKGWELAHDEVRGFNKRASNDTNKLANLYLAARHGLKPPRTLLTNEFMNLRLRGPLIEKPAAGGELTGAFDALPAKLAAATPIARYPRFVQPQLRRPELRVYRVGDALIGFSLSSPDLDYRAALRSRLKPARVPKALGENFHVFCSAIGLDFAAADFMRDPKSGEFRFLEVNSQPMFAAFDKVADGRLCDAIIDHLGAKP